MKGLLALVPVAVAIAGSIATGGPASTPSPVYAGLPEVTEEGDEIVVLDKGRFVVGYDEDKHEPAWVCYRIGPAKAKFLKGNRPKMGFRVDKETSSQVTTSDYVKCGYSRGHMAPSFAMASRFGEDDARSTFIMSNVCPQFQSYNDGQWGNLEEWIAGRKTSGGGFVKGWADTLGEVWVVVGPVFAEALPPLKKGNVAVPSAFFCIVVDEVNGKPRMLAFLMKHEDVRRDDLKPFLTTVDEIERETGLDFFPALPDDIEKAIEAERATALWPLPVNPN